LVGDKASSLNGSQESAHRIGGREIGIQKRMVLIKNVGSALCRNFLKWVRGIKPVLQFNALGFTVVAFTACSMPESNNTAAKETLAESTPVSTQFEKTEIRAVWVSVLAEGLKSPEEIQQLVETARLANLNTIVAQVHREGAAMFNSTIQPRHASIVKRPGFDPLETLLEEARDTSDGKLPLKVHAWFNSFKIGGQKDYLESTPKPIVLTHPEWHTRNRAGEIQYELEQGHPEVQNRMIAVIEECLKQYDVDGVNLDFVRYFGNDRGYNPLALARFQKETGILGRPEAENMEWSDFRRKQISNFVKRCAISVWTYRPKAILSVDATGWGPAPVESFSDTRPYREALQDWGNWSEKGWVDLVLRMGYKREWVEDQKQEFRDWADYTLELIDRSEGRMVTIGIGGHFNPLADTLEQYREAINRDLGTCLFSYDRPTKEAADSEGSLRGHNSRIWPILGKAIYPDPAKPPKVTWRKHLAFIAGFLKDEAGNPIDGGQIALTNTDYKTKSDGAGFFAFYSLQPGQYQLSVPKNSLDGKQVEASAGNVTWVREN
tara:strand:+ start:866 stop:2512 length:1647 start_codon:yes stop_codon:yes gene_type:complete